MDIIQQLAEARSIPRENAINILSTHAYGLNQVPEQVELRVAIDMQQAALIEGHVAKVPPGVARNRPKPLSAAVRRDIKRARFLRAQGYGREDIAVMLHVTTSRVKWLLDPEREHRNL